MATAGDQVSADAHVQRLLLTSGSGFSGWQALNDTVMGGRSSGSVQVGPHGLSFHADVVEQGGGFVSIRSPRFSPPLDLSAYEGLAFDLEADGRRYKLAVACADGVGGLSELIPGGLRWVHEFPTPARGPVCIRIPFSSLRPSLRARPLGLPLRFDPARITRLQLLHSRFGDDGGVNTGFRDGPLQLQLTAVAAYR